MFWRFKRTPSMGGSRPQRITGHSMRTTGVQLMAATGVSEGRISDFGRWVCKQKLRYAREALLARVDQGATTGEPNSKEGTQGTARTSMAAAATRTGRRWTFQRKSSRAQSASAPGVASLYLGA